MQFTVSAQKFAHAGEYMNKINLEYRKLMEDQMSYTSAVAHGKSARKVEKRRRELLSTSRSVQSKIRTMPAYDGDKSLRDSVVAYLKLSYSVLNEDYAKIVDMEAVAEQSYDNMEAYLLAQELASKKLKEASQRLDVTYKTFAEKHNVNLQENNSDKLSEKIEKASQTIAYYNKIYLIFFKVYKQEAYVLDATQRNDVNGIEQNRMSMLQFVSESNTKLKGEKAFKNDLSILNSCKQAMAFYKQEAETFFKKQSDFIMKQEKLQKMQKALESKKNQTKENIDNYNKELAEFNKAVAEINKLSEIEGKKRQKMLETWNKAVASFMSRHVPKHK